MLNKKFRLTKRKEFGYIYKNGKKLNSKALNLVVINTKFDHSRFGFVVSKKVGKAHVRNKIKRQISEIVRTNLQIFPKHNYIFVAKPEIKELTFSEIKQNVFELVEKVKNIKIE